MSYGIYHNKTTLKDTLMMVFEPDKKPNKILKNNDVVELFYDDALVGINIFNFSKYLTLSNNFNGFIPFLLKNELDAINDILKKNGFKEIEGKENSGFVVGKIIECEEHPNSEHLHCLKVDIGSEILDIVCGSYNAKKDLIVVCATINTFMPNGDKIVPSKLLDVPSFGMLCSGKELHIDGYENVRGLYLLDDKYKIGEDFYKKILLK